MQLLKQSTATTVYVGPVLDASGAAVTSAVVGDFRLIKNGTAATLSGATVTHDANGFYTIALTTGNTDTTGRLTIAVGNTAMSMSTHRYSVLLASVFDALITNATNSTGGLPTATGSISALAGAISTFNSATNTVTLAAATHTGAVIPTVTAVTNAVVLPSSATINITGNITGNVSGSVGSVTGNVGGNVVGSVGSIAGVTFPSNFGSLAITVLGGVTVATNGDKTGYSLLAGTGLGNQTANITGSLSGSVGSVTGNVGGNVAGSVGSISGVTFPTHFDNLDIAANGHVTATVDAINNNAITASSIQANALTSAKFAPDSITATAFATDAAVEIAGKVWDEALTNHLTNGSTGYALNNAGGSGNPWITDLATGYTGTQAGNILNQVKAKTDLITTGTIQSSIPVTAQGQITGPLYIGDDYLSANGRAFQWTVALPSGFVIATSTCRFGMEHAEGATAGASFAVAGTVTDAGGGNVTLSFSVPKATTVALKAGFYRWSVEIASASGNEITRVASDGKKLVEWREKQT